MTNQRERDLGVEHRCNKVEEINYLTKTVNQLLELAKDLPHQITEQIRIEEEIRIKSLSRFAKIITWILGTAIALGVIAKGVFDFLDKNKITM